MQNNVLLNNKFTNNPEIQNLELKEKDVIDKLQEKFNKFNEELSYFFIFSIK